MGLERVFQMLAAKASTHWCDFKRGGRECDHGAVTYLVGDRERESGFACEQHAKQMVEFGWLDARKQVRRPAAEDVVEANRIFCELVARR